MTKQQDHQLATISQSVMPVIDIETAVSRQKAVAEFVAQCLVEGIDFGTVPGAGDRMILLKPGAEKLTTLFGLQAILDLVDATEDWSGDQHGGEPFFNYRYSASLYRGDLIVAKTEGSANNWESKYRFRYAEPRCPECGAEAIIKGRPEYNNGIPEWLCYAKKGGCGAKFAINDSRIGKGGLIKNPNPQDIVNTLQKMAQKRALIGSVLVAVNASDYFTQDLDDMSSAPIELIEGSIAQSQTETQSSAKPAQTAKPQTATPRPKASAPLSADDQALMIKAKTWAQSHKVDFPVGKADAATYRKYAQSTPEIDDDQVERILESVGNNAQLAFAHVLKIISAKAKARKSETVVNDGEPPFDADIPDDQAIAEAEAQGYEGTNRQASPDIDIAALADEVNKAFDDSETN